MVSGVPTRTQAVAACVVLALVAVSGQVIASDHKAEGLGKFKVNPLVEVDVTDGSIAAMSTTPSTEDPGPRAFDNSDRFRFNTRYSNTRSVFLLDVQDAQTSGGQTSLTVQGATHQVSSWVYVRQGEGTRFITVEATGVYDADAGSYTAPIGFTRSSQGTVTVRSYDQSSPEDGGTTHTINWIYDATANEYYFDTTDKDFSNGNGELQVAPIAKAAATRYAFTVQTNSYAIGAVAGAGSNYVPTVNVGWAKNPGAGGGNNLDVYVLFDFPSGAPADTYSYTVRGTINDTV